MRLPQKKKPGDPVLAEDWNLLLDAITARTPRPGDGLKFISSSGGFAYSSPRPVDSFPAHPPFSVIGIAKSGGSYLVTMKEGWVVERRPLAESPPAVRFWMPKAGGTRLDAVPRPQVTVGIGQTVWCRVKCKVTGIMDEAPTIEVSTDDQPGIHYYPEDPDASGQPGDTYVKLFKLVDDGDGSPMVLPYQQSDIEVCPYLWTGKNEGGGSRVFKEHKEDNNTYWFRTLVGIAPVKVEEVGGTIEFKFEGSGDLNLTIHTLAYDNNGHVYFNSDLPVTLYWRNGFPLGTTPPPPGPNEPPPGLIEKDVTHLVSQP